MSKSKIKNQYCLFITQILKDGIYLTDADMMKKMHQMNLEPGQSTVSALMSGFRTGKRKPPEGYRVAVRTIGNITSTTFLPNLPHNAPIDLVEVCKADFVTGVYDCQTVSLVIPENTKTVNIKVPLTSTVKIEYYQAE